MELLERSLNEFHLDGEVAFHLRYVESLSSLKVADENGISLLNLKSIISGSWLFLRDKLSGYIFGAKGIIA
jgi:DNA-directed RNA polymerase specialized sigma24 family protein